MVLNDINRVMIADYYSNLLLVPQNGKTAIDIVESRDRLLMPWLADPVSNDHADLDALYEQYIGQFENEKEG